jgi:hypothetical protein
MLLVPPSSLAIDWFEYPEEVNEVNAQRIFDLFSVDPIVVHEDEVLENPETVLAAVYLGIPVIPILYLESVEDYIPEEVMDLAGPSNDA